MQIPPDFDAAVSRGEMTTVRIYVYEGELKSGFAATKIEKFFDDLRDSTVKEHLAARATAGEPGKAVRRDQTKRRPARKSERRGDRRVHPLLHHHSLPHRRDVSGD